MLGGFTFELKSKRLNYSFTISRKITLVVGDSATGKTELCRLLHDSRQPNTGISISCKYQCEDLSDIDFKRLEKKILEISCSTSDQKQNEFRTLLQEYDNTFFICDENFSYLGSNAFAIFCEFTDSFFLIASRTKLPNIPYAFNEIYTLHRSGKYNTLIPCYDKRSFCYLPEKLTGKILTEDSNSGYYFFQSICPNTVSAEGKSNIAKKLEETEFDYIIADGAAFGSEILQVLEIIKRKRRKTKLCLPESFEYCLLNSSLFDALNIKNEITHTENYANGLFFSWERYFTLLLQQLTQNTPAQYSKSQLNKCYIDKCCFRKVSSCPLVRVHDKQKDILLCNSTSVTQMQLF